MIAALEERQIAPTPRMPAPAQVPSTGDRDASVRQLPAPDPRSDPRAAVATRLVLVDDDHDLRLALRELMEEAGYEVVGEAGNGAEGLAVISDARPDVVLLDLRMPGVGGVEVARELRQRSPEVGVIMFSAYADLGLQSLLSDLGVSAYLIKGCPYRRIVAAIEAALADVPRAS